MSATAEYKKQCQEACPEGCGKNKHREMHTFFDKEPDGEVVYGHPGIDPYKSWTWFRCKAPTPEQFMEQQAAEIKRLRVVLDKGDPK